MLKLFLWLRYLCKRRIVLLSVAAVALSVSLLIVVASIFTGFIDKFERSAVEILGDVIMEAPPGKPFARYPELIQRLERTDIVEAATVKLSSEGLLHVGGGTGNVRPVSIWGIDPAGRARVTGFKDALLRQGTLAGEPTFDVPGKPSEVGGFVGIGVVTEPDEETDEYDQDQALAEMIGQRLLITTGTIADDSDPQAAPKRRLIPFYVADVVFMGVYEFDSAFVYVPIETLQEALYPDVEGPIASTINVRLMPGVDAELAAVQLRGLWREFAATELNWSRALIAVTDIVTARQMQYRYVAALRQQMGILLLIFGVVSFSVVVLVFCIFYMMVSLKLRDVAIVKSCGASSFSVAWIFLGFSVTIGLLGCGIGSLLGYLITRNINTIEDVISVVFGLKIWRSSVYLFSRIPNQVDWRSALPIVALAIAAAAVGALVPALIAARTRPVEVLRYE
jgi:ABC-type lipoprotein release transport system permease subunit